MPAALPDGLYEHLVTEALARDIASTAKPVALRDLDPQDAHVLIARHVSRQVERALLAIPASERKTRQLELAASVLASLAHGSENDLADEQIAPPPRRLEQVGARTLSRPGTPLSSSTLLTRNRAEPALGQEIARELASSDQVDVLIAFITVGGIRALRDALESFANQGGTMRVLTTTFSGTTEVEAIEALARLPGVEVRISYDVRRTRLHAKAWLFRRASGLHAAYVGSANLTQTALGAGQEWMVKACAADLPHVIEKFSGTFDSLWNDPEFEPYTCSDEQRDRLRRALHAERGGGRGDEAQVLFALRPFPFQEAILDRLDAERTLQGRRRNLVVAATGTGKTVIAAFDYLRQTDRRGGIRPRLLFLAHRRELLEQARATFRSVLQDRAFGELWTDGALPEQWEHVFATVQSAATELLRRFPPDHFRHVIVDECHHTPADSYQRLVPHLQPDVLLGLTATPERADGRSLLEDFGGQVAAELRLWHALDRQLLVPFEYYGVSDGVDLQRLRWSRSGYATSELSNLYTGNEARVDLIVAQLHRRVPDLRQVRALAFCVSVEHAEYMAEALRQRGLPALAVHGRTPDEIRADAPRRLRERAVNVLCTCDLYNEGVDLPFVDTLLLLRPTSSATVFLQQIGRGLRLDHGKTSCLVLDFIGQHRSEFRFDAIYSALTGIPRSRIQKDCEQGFPYLPSGCILQLDAVARDRLLASLRASLQSRLVKDLKELAQEGAPSLAGFLEATGREAEDVYRGDGSWSKLKAQAGLGPANDTETLDLTRRLGWLLHVDEPARLQTWTSLIEQAQEGQLPPLSPLDRRRLHMLDFQLQHRGELRVAEETARDLASRPAVRAELRELADYLQARISLAADRYPVPSWPLALHRRYGRREILAAIGKVDAEQKRSTTQGGILKLEAERRELLFVTLDKSASSFSPTTRYRDYAVSPDRFHWETQAAAAVDRPSGRRYLDSPDNQWTFHLFVREDPDAPYAFLGPAHYLSHTGNRPIGILWKLTHAMPAALFERFATLAQG